MNEERDGPRIARYVAGRCTPDEAAEMRRWLAQDPVRAALVNGLVRVWELVRRVSFVWDVDGAWRAMGLGREPDHSLPLSMIACPERSEGSRSWAWRVAAVAVVACATLTGVLSHRSRGAGGEPLREIATRRGQRASLRLADGTLVDLGVASVIRYASTYGRKQRDVYLEGEAYFEVAPDPRKPFTVYAANAITRDRGTKFGVRAYPGASQVDVVVVEGAVELSGRVLGTADLGRLDRRGRLRIEHGADTAAWLGWRRDRLVFNNTPLREALPQLNRWYDADLELGDSALGDYPLTASLHGEPLDKVLDLISAALNVRVVRRGTTILLYRRRPAP
ncbi:MAG TPA: FecR domain-containing protein [Gemmatimonadales bacterium]